MHVGKDISFTLLDVSFFGKSLFRPFESAIERTMQRPRRIGLTTPGEDTATVGSLLVNLVYLLFQARVAFGNDLRRLQNEVLLLGGIPSVELMALWRETRCMTSMHHPGPKRRR